MTQTSPQFVAHRGCPSRFPENTLLGVDYALRCGAKWIEVDVQLTADGTPVLCHDPMLDRSSRLAQSVMQSSLAELQHHGAGFAERFGMRFRGVPFATLSQLCTMIRNHNAGLAEGHVTRLFVELKGESALQFGHQFMVDQVLAALSNHAETADLGAVISFDETLCQLVLSSSCPCGWVLAEWDSETKRRAEAMAPQFLFTSVKQLPRSRNDIWQGPWQWVIYTVNDFETAVAMAALGIDLVETDCIDRMMGAE